jgi:hypothetical protein
MPTLWALPKINKINDLSRFFHVLREVQNANRRAVLIVGGLQIENKPNRRTY